MFYVRFFEKQSLRNEPLIIVQLKDNIQAEIDELNAIMFELVLENFNLSMEVCKRVVDI